MRRFGRVTCCGGETRLLFRFAHLHVCSTEWQWCLPTPPLTVQYCYLLATSAACLHSLIYLYIYIVIILFIHASHTGLLPACRWVCALLHTEGCCSIMSCAHPDTSVCFASLPFSAITYAAGYTVGTHVLFFHRCVSQHVRVQRLVLNVLAETGLNPGSQWQRGWACLRSLHDFVHEAVTHRKDSAAT